MSFQRPDQVLKPCQAVRSAHHGTSVESCAGIIRRRLVGYRRRSNRRLALEMAEQGFAQGFGGPWWSRDRENGDRAPSASRLKLPAPHQWPRALRLRRVRVRRTRRRLRHALTSGAGVLPRRGVKILDGSGPALQQRSEVSGKLPAAGSPTARRARGSTGSACNHTIPPTFCNIPAARRSAERCAARKGFRWFLSPPARVSGCHPDCSARTASSTDCMAASYRMRISSTGDADCTRWVKYSWCGFGERHLDSYRCAQPDVDTFSIPAFGGKGRHKKTTANSSSPLAAFRRFWSKVTKSYSHFMPSSNRVNTVLCLATSEIPDRSRRTY